MDFTVAIYWICFYLLPQLIMVNFRQFLIVMHSFDVYIWTCNIFQALGVVIMSIGLKGTLKTIIKFPPIILTPMFSIWTIGPIASTKSVCGSSCCKSPQKLGVSIFLTWMNLLLTLSLHIAHAIWSEVQNSIGFLSVSVSSSCLCFAIAMLQKT